MMILDNVACYRERRSFKQVEFQLQLKGSRQRKSQAHRTWSTRKTNDFPLLPSQVQVKPQSAKQQRVVKLRVKFAAISTASEEEPANVSSDRPASCRGRCLCESFLLAGRDPKLFKKKKITLNDHSSETACLLLMTACLTALPKALPWWLQVPPQMGTFALWSSKGCAEMWADMCDVIPFCALGRVVG